ncbi:dynein regulatory complex protein 9 [Holotrichia oblita]|uniref:Dynein regulatory complex protein 9 n=1 Tax=Holotrichia oblita TaxID=644536 RepID=A0ACB9SWH6_HOLOL|nr:dynein regulatory complex protein 9 [Holotrichia oblita]
MDAFKVKSIHLKEWHDGAYEHFLDDFAKDYEMNSMSKRDSCIVPVSSRQISIQQVKRELCFMKRAPFIVLNECLDKLVVLRTIMGEKIDSRWYKKITYRPPNQRFASDECGDEFDIYEYTNRRKLAKLISIIHSTLYDTLMNMDQRKSVHNLITTVDVFEQEDMDAMSLIADFNENVVDFLMVTRQTKDSHDKNRHTYQNKVRDLSKMENKYEDLILYSDIKRRYLDKWENNRCYLNDFRNNSVIQDLNNTIEDYTEKIMLENRIHHETCSYFNGTYNACDHDIERWLRKYDDDLEHIEGNIFEIKINLERCENEFKLLKDDYESRSREMERWVQFKEEMRQKLEHDLRLIAAVTKIQAFWRGVMVRKHLGPYSNKKKGKGKGKDKKKGKKTKK